MDQRNSGAVRVALGVLAAGAVAGTVGVAIATAQQAATIGTTPQNRFSPAEVSVQTGQTVTWNFDGSTADHNVRGEDGPDEDPVWIGRDSGFKRSGTYTYTFNVPGDFHFVCDAHPGMEGTVKVAGTPTVPTVVPPDPGATATPVPGQPSVTPVPTVDRRTPAPQGTVRADTTPPAVSKLKLRGLKRGAKVSFTLSESAAVTIRAKKGKSTVRTLRLAARTGARSVTVRGLARSTRYSVEIEARDARGNKAAVQRKTVRVAR